MNIKILDNFDDIISQYELFIVDVFGVIHDGLELYPEVFQNIGKIKKQNKHFVFLSNAPRRAVRVEQTLAKFGITKNLYDFVMTSGEYAFLHFQNLAKVKYYYFGPDKDKKLLDGTDHQMVSCAADADIAISTGLDPEQILDDAMPDLYKIKEHNLTLHCINPDKFVYKQDGRSHICAGLIADSYIKMGGTVEYYGKPYVNIYEHILANFPNISKDKIISIGDGMETDIKGANNIGIESILITSGMHVRELDSSIGILPDMSEMEKLTKKYNSSPDYIAALF